MIDNTKKVLVTIRDGNSETIDTYKMSINGFNAIYWFLEAYDYSDRFEIEWEESDDIKELDF